MTTNTEKLQALEDAIFSGATSINIDGQQVTYRSLSEMERIALRLRNQISGINKRPKIASMGATLRHQ